MNFTEAYMDYCSDQTDAPPAFHKILSYVILASVVGKNVSMRFGFKRLYTNLYILLVAPSSVYRKSWSLGIANHVLDLIRPNFAIIDCSSRNSFIAELSQPERNASGLIKIDELSGFMKRIKQDQHFSGFLQDLASAYDGFPLTRRKGVSEKEKEIFVVNEPFLNIMAACSNDWLNKSMETGDITGGGFARFLWTVCDGKVSNPWPEPKPHSEAKLGLLIEKLTTIGNYIGEARFDDEAAALFGKWYGEFRTQNQGGKWDQSYERLVTIAKKLSILNCISRCEEEGQPLGVSEFLISKRDIGLAVTWMETATAYFDKIAVGDNPDEVLRNKVYHFIQNHQPATKSDILRGMRIDAWHLKNCLETLLQAEQVFVQKSTAENNKEIERFST